MVIRCIHETHASVQKPKPLAKQDCTTRMKVATNVSKTVSTIIEGMVGVSQPTLQSPQFTHVHLYSVQICELQLCICLPRCLPCEHEGFISSICKLWTLTKVLLSLDHSFSWVICSLGREKARVELRTGGASVTNVVYS